MNFWRSYKFFTKDEADIFARAFNMTPKKEFDEKVGQTVFVFQW